VKKIPRWYRRQQLFGHSVPPELYPWLFDASSLTLRLQSLCPKKFRVQLLQQHWQKMEPGEASAMQLPGQQSALVRQVLLCCGQTPLVYARTVIPSVTLIGAQRRYANMGSRPLGAMLFADRSMRREQVMVSQLDHEHPVLAGLGIEADVWGRRSVFRVSGKPLLVSEFFLPALFQQLR
jgi:chorismate--pyruvate lyase